MAPAVPIALVLLASAALLVACGAPDRDGGPARTVLLTGFEPFGERTVNDSWEAVRVLEGQTVAGRRVAVARLPVVYDGVGGPLAAAIERERPEVVLSFGEGTEVVRVETAGRNGYNAKRPLDNAGRPPPRDAIEPAGPAVVSGAIPAARIVAAWGRAGLPSRESDDAGGYLCNECLYRLLRYAGPGADGVRRRGFVHLPVAGTMRPDGTAWELSTLRAAVRIALEETLADLDASPAAR